MVYKAVVYAKANLLYFSLQAFFLNYFMKSYETDRKEKEKVLLFLIKR